MFSEEHRKEGKRLQKDILRFQDEFRGMVDDVWTESSPLPPLTSGKPASSDIHTNGVDSGDKARPPKPLISAQNWTIRFWK
jgi:hypothetical protein